MKVALDSWGVQNRSAKTHSTVRVSADQDIFECVYSMTEHLQVFTFLRIESLFSIDCSNIIGGWGGGSNGYQASVDYLWDPSSPPPSEKNHNRPYSYSQYWTGTSLQWRLMRGMLFKCKLFLKYSPALASIAS